MGRAKRNPSRRGDIGGFRFALPILQSGRHHADWKLPVRKRGLRSRRRSRRRSFIATAAPAARRMDRPSRRSPTSPATAFAGSEVKACSGVLNPRPARRGISARNAARISSPSARARTPSCCGWAVWTRRSPSGPRCISGDRTALRGSTRRISCPEWHGRHAATGIARSAANSPAAPAASSPARYRRRGRSAAGCRST